MKTSRLMLIHYLSGLAILLLGATHFASLTFLGIKNYDEALLYNSIAAMYKGWTFLLEFFLLFVSFHTFNGFRTILLELRQGRRYEQIVTVVTLIAGLLVFIYGTRTIILALVAT